MQFRPGVKKADVMSLRATIRFLTLVKLKQILTKICDAYEKIFIVITNYSDATPQRYAIFMCLARN